MFTNSIEYYDQIYSEFKDYSLEAKKINEFIRARSPKAKTILDVGCGTGEHAKILTEEYGFFVDGIDLEPGFVEIAQMKCPQGAFSLADMTNFDLDKKYDVVTCLFSAIGYVKTVENTKKAIRCFSKHVKNEGLILVEPWIEKGKMEHGKYFLRTIDKDGLKVARISYSEIIGNVSRITFEYLIGTDGKMIRETEIHELGLLERGQIEECFRSNRLECEYYEEGPSGRGLFVASHH